MNRKLFRTDDTPNLGVDGLRQQKTKSGFMPWHSLIKTGQLNIGPGDVFPVCNSPVFWASVPVVALDFCSWLRGLELHVVFYYCQPSLSACDALYILRCISAQHTCKECFTSFLSPPETCRCVERLRLMALDPPGPGLEVDDALWDASSFKITKCKWTLI